MKNFQERIAENLRHHRVESNLSQGKLSKICGLHRSYVGKIERGKKTPSMETLQKISDALFLPLSALFDRRSTGDPSSNRETAPRETVYRKVFECATRPMAVVQADGTAVKVNTAYEISRETARENVLGEPIWEAEIPSVKRDLKEIFPVTAGSMRRNGSPPTNPQTVPRRMSGKGNEWLLSAIPNEDEREERFLLECIQPPDKFPDSWDHLP